MQETPPRQNPEEKTNNEKSQSSESIAIRPSSDYPSYSDRYPPPVFFEAVERLYPGATRKIIDEALNEWEQSREMRKNQQITDNWISAVSIASAIIVLFASTLVSLYLFIIGNIVAGVGAFSLAPLFICFSYVIKVVRAKRKDLTRLKDPPIQNLLAKILGKESEEPR